VKIIHKEITIKAPVEKCGSISPIRRRWPTGFYRLILSPALESISRSDVQNREQFTARSGKSFLVQSWFIAFKADIAKAETLVTFALFPIGEHTRLILTHSGWERLESEQEAVFKLFEQGWEHHFLKRLQHLLDMNDDG
jgi:hypothetical protein